MEILLNIAMEALDLAIRIAKPVSAKILMHAYDLIRKEKENAIQERD